MSVCYRVVSVFVMHRCVCVLGAVVNCDQCTYGETCGKRKFINGAVGVECRQCRPINRPKDECPMCLSLMRQGKCSECGYFVDDL